MCFLCSREENVGCLSKWGPQVLSLHFPTHSQKHKTTASFARLALGCHTDRKEWGKSFVFHYKVLSGVMSFVLFTLTHALQRSQSDSEVSKATERWYRSSTRIFLSRPGLKMESRAGIQSKNRRDTRRSLSDPSAEIKPPQWIDITSFKRILLSKLISFTFCLSACLRNFHDWYTLANPLNYFKLSRWHCEECAHSAYFFIAWLHLSALSASARAECFFKETSIYETKPTSSAIVRLIRCQCYLALNLKSKLYFNATLIWYS